MKNNKRYTLINKSDVMFCYKCEGKGFVYGEDCVCSTCNGSGKWIEPHYIIIDEKNKIAIDSDMGS